MKIKKLLYVVVSLLLFTVSSIADDITLDFEGLKDYEEVQNFYNGGAGSKGSTNGVDYNITFSANTLALIDRDAGGNGNFANEPSPDTAFFFVGGGNSIYMNVEGGFTEGFSFYYTSIYQAGDVEVWTEPNGQGKKIGSLHLDVTPQLGKGDPSGDWDNWAKKSLSFDGRAKSIVFKGVANQIAFDNITLNPNAGEELLNGTTISSFQKILEDLPIEHNDYSDIANTIRISFILKSTENDLSLICDKFQFSIIGDSSRGATQTNCNIEPITHILKKDEKKLIINFQIFKKNEGYFFENGKLRVTNKKTKKHKDYNIWKNFNVYGTSFNLKKDAFQFNNGTWNKANKTDYVDEKYTVTHNKLAELVHIIEPYVDINKQKEVWESVGYKAETIHNKFGRNYSWRYFGKDNKSSDGLCYGMSHVSLANFIHKNKQVWGMGKLNIFNQQILSHWNTTTKEAKKSELKPYLTDDIYHTYKKNDIEALKKILYFFVAQPHFKTDRNTWVGKERNLITGKTDELFIKQYSKDDDVHKYLTHNMPIPFSFSYKGGGGHSILNTQVIEYDNSIVFYFYDNSRNKSYTRLIANRNTGKTESYVHSYSHLYSFGITAPALSDSDPLHIFPIQDNKTNEEIITKQTYVKYQKIKNQSKDISYISNKHIEIYTVGGSFKKVSLKSDDSFIKLYPISATLEKDKAYKNEENIFNNTLLLPIDKFYKVTVKKEVGFNTLKLFVTIPKADGTAEYLVYDHAETSKEDATMVTFTVGRDNTDKSLKREGASDYAPDTEKVYKLKLTSATSINAIVLQNGVQLSWKNPTHPNYEESVVVRKEGSIPTSITDGTEIYRGTDESFLDTTMASEKKYYYAVYAVSKDNEPTEPVWTDVDTYKYTLYGTLSDASDEPIAGATVTLYNGTKTRLIETSFSSDTGLFSFNNLLDGEYVLNFSHPSYSFEKSELNVTVEKKSKEVLMKAEGVANLFMEIPQAVKVGESQSIIWDGIHIDDSATVNIKLFRNEKWETVASSVPYNQHSYKWNVTAPKGEAKLRIELDDTTFVEQDVFIFGADEVKYDFDGDGDVDIDDIMTVVGGWTAQSGDAKFKSEYDYNGDGVIDIKDIMKIASKWGM